MMIPGRRQVLGGLLAGGAALVGGGMSLAAEPGVSDTPLPRFLDNRRIIIDTDPGNDDAIALLMGLTAPKLKVEAVTVTPGNVDYDQQVKNALYVVDFAGMAGKVAVHRGAGRPLLGRSYAAANFIHGATGLGGFTTPEVKQAPDPEPAVDAIRRIVRKYPGEVVIAALGGLTNVATALLVDPELARMIKGVQFVGGAGNAVPGFNALADPEAVHVVLTSGVPVALGVVNSLLLPEDFDRIAAFKTRFSEFFMQTNALRLAFEMKARGAKGSVNADPMAMALLIDPSIGLAYKAIHARVELEGQYTRGTILYGENRYNMQPTPPANANLCVEADNAKFKALLFETLRRA